MKAGDEKNLTNTIIESQRLSFTFVDHRDRLSASKKAA
jgi:hypothetical protein